MTRSDFGVHEDMTWSQWDNTMRRIRCIKGRVAHQMAVNIRKERKRIGLSQNRLEDVLGVSMGTVSAWEASRRVPRWEELYMMCCLFNRSADYMIGFAQEEKELELEME